MPNYSSTNGFMERTVSWPSNSDHMSMMMEDLDFSLLDQSNALFENNQLEDQASLPGTQFQFASSSESITSPVFFEAIRPNCQDQNPHLQYFPKKTMLSCDCHQTLSLACYSPQQPENRYHHQLPTPRHSPEEGQNHHFHLAASDESLARTCSSCTRDQRSSPSRLEQQSRQTSNRKPMSLNSPLLEVPVPSRADNPSQQNLASLRETAADTTTNKTPYPTITPTHPPISDCDAPETRFDRILEVIEEAGFDSIDNMASCYYTTKFSPSSLCASAQSLSRRRHLRRFLEDVREDARTWEQGEAQGYQEGILGSAVSVCIDELRRFKENRESEGGKGLKKVLETVFDREKLGDLKEEKRIMREKVRSPVSASHFPLSKSSVNYLLFLDP
jgi:hypothetical protein